MYLVPQPLSCDTFVSAAVKVVFPWSTCPIVPTFTCGLVRSNLALAMCLESWCTVETARLPVCRLFLRLRDDLLGDVLRHFLIVVELHRVHRAALGHAPERGGVPEHFSQRHVGRDHLRLTALGHAADLAAAAGEVADDVAEEV